MNFEAQNAVAKNVSFFQVYKSVKESHSTHIVAPGVATLYTTLHPKSEMLYVYGSQTLKT